MTIEEMIRSIQAFAERRSEMVAVYVFGSALTKGNPRDIDLAIVLDPHEQGVDAFYSFGYRSAITAELMCVLNRNNVDVVLWHEASPVLAMEILRNGRMVFSRRGYDRIAEEKSVRNRYIDTAPLRRIKAAYFRKRYLRAS